MTDQTPRTEAGRRFIDRIAYYGPPVPVADVLAIEAQARAEADARHSQHDYNAGVADGLAQARTEALDAIREHLRHVSPSRDFDMDHEKLRAILAGETE